MTRWLKKVEIKHLFTEEEDYDSIQKSMNAVADVLEENEFPTRLTKPFREIPQDYSLVIANSLLSAVYDYADMKKVWLE